jgi:hypothetical protein
MDEKNIELNSFAVAELSDQNEGRNCIGSKDAVNRDDREMAYFGRQQQLKARPFFRNQTRFLRDRANIWDEKVGQPSLSA